jgi:uncharacterized protein YdhG (YjbR/CyaY superfamily)
MQSTAADVDTYVAEAPADRQEILRALRDACRDVLPDFEEAMTYGMPTYLREGVAEVGWASQKQYISLYILRTDVLNSHREHLTGLNVGKGCIRFRRPSQVDMDIVRSMLTATQATRASVC